MLLNQAATSAMQPIVSSTSVELACGESTPETPACSTQTSSSSSAAARRTRILIVDDDSRCGRLLEANLASAGYQVTIASDAEQARRFALDEPPNLVLCDVCLPGMDGIELTSWLRSQAATSTVPILLITSSNDGKILSRGLEAGADDFLTKPVHSSELRARVQSLLRTQVLADELRAREEAAVSCEAYGQIVHAANAAARCDAGAPHGNAADSILVVEDDKREARLLVTHLKEIGYPIRVVHDVRSALAALAEEVPSLLVLDIILPDQSGYDLIEHMKQNPRWERVPILAVSGMADVSDRVKALQLGADDFILKGFDRIEFDARVRRLLRLKRHWDQLDSRCNQAMQLAVTDSLTGLYTHGFLQEALQRELVSARKQGRFVSLMFADVDHFKQINDHNGHSAGDEILKALAQTFRGALRHGDILVRYGGEEFVALLPHTSRADATRLAQRVRAEIESRAISILDANLLELKVTVSIGVASFPEDATDAECLLDRADEAMYLAKQAGRNNVVVFGQAATTNPETRKILLVDDDDKNLRLLQAYLTPEGYQTIVARDGIEAIDLARRSQPDLILMDAMMPRLSGFDACRRLKQEQATCLIPVVIVTALGGREERLRGIEAGADDFLRKPIDKVELLTRARALLRAKRTTDLLEDSETVIFTLARAVEARDPSTGDHIERVSRYAVALGKAVGVRGPQLDGLRRAGIVHDIGKIVVPDAVLLKPGKLTPEERAIMERHVEAGYELLRPLRTFGESLAAVRFHHERRDGSGYPNGLRGSQIPFSAQIMAIVDVYDALTNDRAYRKALSCEEAIALLREEAARGLHDPALLEAFINTVNHPSWSDSAACDSRG